MVSRWKEVRLREVCTINPPKKQQQHLYNNQLVSFIAMSDVTENGGINVNNEKPYSEVSSGFSYFIENDVLFAKITPCMENGKRAIARGLINGLGVGSTEFHVFRPNTEFVTSDWIYRIISTSKFRKSAERHMTGSAGQKRVPKNFLDDVLIPLPSLEMQKKIAEVLDMAQELIDKRKRQIELLDKFLQSLFIEMFGDPVQNPNGWEEVKLKSACNKITDGTHNSPPNNKTGDYLYLTAKNIRKYGLDLKDVTYVAQEEHSKIYSRCNPEKGDILYIKDGVTTGIAQINTLEYEFSMLSSVALIKLKKEMLSEFYLRAFLNYPSTYSTIRTNMGGAAITRLTLNKIEEIRILVPPLDLQNKFASIVEATEKQRELMKRSLALMEMNLKGLMQRAFRGELFN